MLSDEEIIRIAISEQSNNGDSIDESRVLNELLQLSAEVGDRLFDLLIPDYTVFKAVSSPINSLVQVPSARYWILHGDLLTCRGTATRAVDRLGCTVRLYTQRVT
jgi:hypothetical protein